MDILGIDIGGSALKAAPVNAANGRLTAQRLRVETPKPATPAAVADVVQTIRDYFHWTGPIGCGLPSVIRNGVACTAANIDQSWIGTDVTRLFSATTGRDVTVLNDADAAGLAEMRFGAGQDAIGTTLVVTAGTGLGSALFRGQTLVPNTELGHLPLHGTTAERFASAAVLTQLSLSYEEWAQRLSDFLALLEDLFWPDRLILGGAISQNHNAFFPYLKTRALLLPAALRNDAGIIGAAVAALP